LLVNGSFQADGSLEVSLINGFKPAVGNSFELIDCAILDGQFGTLKLPVLGGRLLWNTSQLYGASSATISVLATYYAGDFNCDSFVNITDVAAMENALADLTAYQATHGPGAGALTDHELVLVGDLTGDNKVTNADVQGLINLLANGGGSGAPGGGSLTAVPEPAAWSSALIALAGAAAFQKRHWRL